MEKKDYLRERVEDQINWYSQKSSKNKCCYYTIKITEIILGLLVSIISLFLKESILKIIVTTLSLSTTTLNGLLFFLNCQENWTEYRKTSEILKHEKYMFLASAGVYNIDETERYKLFVERCETIISSENINWAQLNNDEEKKK